MATNNKVTNVTEDGPTSLICKLCDKPYQHKDGPLMLPCLHSFCKPCLVAHLKKEEDSPGNKMACPTCTTKIPRPKDVSNFPYNLRLSNLAKSAQYEKLASTGKVRCEVCDNEDPKKATNFCCNCSEFLCTKCKKYHERFLTDDSHKFIELSSYEKGEFKIHPSAPKCPKHTKYELEFFCEDCKTLICLSCAQTKHQNHVKTSIEDTAEKEKSELQEMTKGIDNALSTMDSTLQQVQAMREKVKVSSKEALERIDKACDDLIAAVEKRREGLKTKCREVAEGKEDVLSNQMVEVQRVRNDLSFVQHHVRDAVDNHRPEELLGVKKLIQDRLNTVTEQYQQLSMEVSEDDAINPVIKIQPLVEEIEKTGTFPGVPDPSKCNAYQSIWGQEEKQVTVTLRDEDNSPVQGTAHFQYQLQKVGNEDIDDHLPAPKVTINQLQNNSGTATLRFTPDKPDDVYELTVMVRNRPIADPVTVRTPITKDYKNIGNVQPTYKNVGGHCYGVAVHSNGTVYATNYDQHTVKMFRPDGTESQFSVSDDAGGKLSHPWGITILGDTVYVVNYWNNTVRMFSTDGRVIGGFGGRGSGNGQLSSPMGICIDQEDRILVADQGNSRIQFFTLEGEFIKSIQCNSNVWDVAINPTTGNIHVALYNNRHIAVYSPQDDRLIETYNLNGNLKCPSGIHIDPVGYQFITARDDNKMYIVDPTGELIFTMATKGGTGIQLDKKGTLYVAEYSSSRVAIY